MSIIETKTRYVSWLICNHEDIVCFYRSGRELAIHNKNTGVLSVGEATTPQDMAELKFSLESLSNLIPKPL